MSQQYFHAYIGGKKKNIILRRKNNNLIKNIKRAVLSYLPVNFRQISVFLAFFFVT